MIVRLSVRSIVDSLSNFVNMQSLVSPKFVIYNSLFSKCASLAPQHDLHLT